VHVDAPCAARGLICACQVIVLIDDLPSCEELVQRRVTECRSALKDVLAAT
jgi:hypothetical protein